MAQRRKFTPKPPKVHPRKSKDIDISVYADFLRALLAREIQPKKLIETRDNLGRLNLEYDE